MGDDATQLELLEHYRIVPAQIDSKRRRKHEAQWIRQHELGRGASGTVYYETEESSRAARAVKEIRKIPGYDFKQELIALTRLSKPAYADYFGQFLGWWETDTLVAFAIQYFEHGDLRSFMQEKKIFTEEEAKDITWQLLSGLRIMHADGFTHRDLKPENIFVLQKEPTLRIKIGDFGVSKRVHDETLLQTFVGTRHYLAPELLDFVDYNDEDDDIGSDSGTYTNAVDIWAVGIIAYELLVNSKPFRDSKALRMYCKDRMDAKFPRSVLEQHRVSDGGVILLKSMLSSKPSGRPSAETALVSPWLEVDQQAPSPTRTSIQFDTLTLNESVAALEVSQQAPFSTWTSIHNDSPTPSNSDPVQSARRVNLGTVTTALRTIKYPAAFARTVRFSPDCKLMASGWSDGRLRLWDMTRRAARWEIKHSKNAIIAVAFSADGRLVMSGDELDFDVKVFDAATGDERFRFTTENPYGYVTAIAFSPDSTQIASASDTTIQLLDTATGTARLMLEGHKSAVKAVAVSPDGRLVAAGGLHNIIWLWDAATGAMRRLTVQGDRDFIEALSFSPDGRLLASGFALSSIRLWNTVTGVEQLTYKDHESMVTAVAFPPDGQVVASCSFRGGSKLWDTETGATCITFDGSGPVWDVAFSPDSQLVASASHMGIKLWDASAVTAHDRA